MPIILKSPGVWAVSRHHIVLQPVYEDRASLGSHVVPIRQSVKMYAIFDVYKEATDFMKECAATFRKRLYDSNSANEKHRQVSETQSNQNESKDVHQEQEQEQNSDDAKTFNPLVYEFTLDFMKLGKPVADDYPITLSLCHIPEHIEDDQLARLLVSKVREEQTCLWNSYLAARTELLQVRSQHTTVECEEVLHIVQRVLKEAAYETTEANLPEQDIDFCMNEIVTCWASSSQDASSCQDAASCQPSHDHLDKFVHSWAKMTYQNTYSYFDVSSRLSRIQLELEHFAKI